MENITEACWEGYKQVGMKDKGGKMVPNCVPMKELHVRPEFKVTSDSDFKPDEDNLRTQFGSETHTPGHMNELNEGEYCPRCLVEYIIRKKLGPLEEAEYQGHKVALGKPMRGDVKKFKVYVKDPKTGNVKKVNFGDKTMRIKKSNPNRRRSFRARHHCDTNPGPRTKARYWSCRKW